jgi:hypothetical protein
MKRPRSTDELCAIYARVKDCINLSSFLQSAASSIAKTSRSCNKPCFATGEPIRDKVITSRKKSIWIAVRSTNASARIHHHTKAITRRLPYCARVTIGRSRTGACVLSSYSTVRYVGRYSETPLRIGSRQYPGIRFRTPSALQRPPPDGTMNIVARSTNKQDRLA